MKYGKAGLWGVRVVVLLAIVGQIACGETDVPTDPVPEDRGDLTLLISGGDISHTLTGNAVFGTAPKGNGETDWVLFLWRGARLFYTYQFDVVDLFRASLERPDPGTYTLAAHSEGPPADDAFAGRYVYSFVISYGVFHIESGTLTIDSSSDQEIAGSFELNAVLDESRSTDVPTQTATLSGTFRAVPGDIPTVN